MHRFFIRKDSYDIMECDDHLDYISIKNKDDVRHISKVLRLKTAEKIEVVDVNHRLYLCEIVKISDNNGGEVVCKIIEEIAETGESPVDIILYQGIPKGEKFDIIIQKCVELGIAKIVPIIFERCVVKCKNDKSSDKKLTRWNRIAYEAAKQSKRCIIPTVEAPITVKQLSKRLSDDEELYNHLSLLFYEDEKKTTLKDIVSTYRTFNNIERKTINIIVGAEGGITSEEVLLLTDAGVHSVSLGNRILRTETAGIVATAIMQYELGDLG